MAAGGGKGKTRFDPNAPSIRQGDCPQLYNKGACSRKDCPFLHVRTKVIPTGNQTDLPEAPNRRGRAQTPRPKPFTGNADRRGTSVSGLPKAMACPEYCKTGKCSKPEGTCDLWHPTKVCKFWLKNKCEAGDHCTFLHFKKKDD